MQLTGVVVGDLDVDAVGHEVDGHVRRGRRVHVEVADDDTSELHAVQASPDAESGRGLALVEALADRWGQVALPDGKVVWFDVLRGVSG